MIDFANMPLGGPLTPAQAAARKEGRLASLGISPSGQLLNLPKAPQPPAQQPTKPAPKQVDLDTQDDDDPRALTVRQRERERVFAIVTSVPAHSNPALALAIATTTSTPRGEAIQIIRDFNQTMARHDTATETEARSAGVPADLAGKILAAGRRARGETVEPPARAMSAAAKAIIDAGRRRRGEI